MKASHELLEQHIQVEMQFKEQRERLVQQVSELTSELTRTLNMQKDLENRNKQLESECCDAQRINSSLREEANQLHGKLQAVHRDNSTLRADVSELQKTCKCLQLELSSREESAQTVQLAENQKQQLEIRIFSLEQENTGLRSRITAYEEQTKQLRRQVQDLQEQENKHEMNEAKYIDNVSNLDYQREIEHMQQENSKLRAVVASMQQHVLEYLETMEERAKQEHEVKVSRLNQELRELESKYSDHLTILENRVKTNQEARTIAERRCEELSVQLESRNTATSQPPSRVSIGVQVDVAMSRQVSSI